MKKKSKNINEVSPKKIVDIVVDVIDKQLKETQYYPKDLNVKDSFEPNAKVIGKVTNARIDENGNLVYGVEITDKEMIDKICNNSPKKMSVGYKKK